MSKTAEATHTNEVHAASRPYEQTHSHTHTRSHTFPPVKTLIAAILSLLMLVCTAMPSHGTTSISSPNASSPSPSPSPYLAPAETLNALGLFNGTATGFDLERNATRAEAAVMLVRLLGHDACMDYRSRVLRLR